MKTWRARVGEKGQVVIPKGLRDRLGISPGQPLEFSEERGRLVATKAVLQDPVDQLYGSWGGRRSTDELMNEIRGKPRLP